jgi:flavin-binding protein dodecin
MAKPKFFTGASREGIEDAIDKAVHSAGRGFKHGDQVRVVDIRATLRRESPWHITTYTVTIEKV